MLRIEGTGLAVNITVKKNDRLEYVGETSEGWVVHLFSKTDWVLDKKDGKRDEDFTPKPLSATERKELFFQLKEAKEKAKADAVEEWDADIAMDEECVEVLRKTGQPTAVQREVLVLGIAQGW